MTPDPIPPTVAAVLREAGERPWHVAFGEYYIEAQNREIVAKAYPGTTPDVDRAAAICWAVNHAQGWMDELARWKRSFDGHVYVKNEDYIAKVTALRDAEAALAHLVGCAKIAREAVVPIAQSAIDQATKVLATIRVLGVKA